MKLDNEVLADKNEDNESEIENYIIIGLMTLAL